MTEQNLSLAATQRQAYYGRKTWLFWNGHGRPLTPDNLKAAVASGEKWLLVDADGCMDGDADIARNMLNQMRWR